MIGSSENRISYDGNGIATEFAYTFKILEKSDLFVLHVAIDGTETLLTKDYYVDMEKSVVLYPGYAPGAEIPEAERPPILPVGERLVLYRQVPITQESALDKHWPFSVIEDGLDKLTIICQQIWDRLGRSFYVSESTSTNFNPKVPIEPGKTFRVKDDGTGFEVTEDPGKVIDGATALLEQTTEQANIAVVNSTNAQNAANAAEAVAPEYAKTKAVLDNIVSYTNTATEQAEIATTQANLATTRATNAANSATNAAQSYANADAVATQLTEYLATKESLTAPAVDYQLILDGAAADSKRVGEYINSCFLESRNICDEQFINGYYVNNVNGNISDNTSYKYIDYIRILPNVNYVIRASNSNELRCAVYDGNKNFITGYVCTTQTGYISFTTQENAKYLAVSVYNDVLWLQIEKGEIPTGYVKKNISLKGDLLIFESIPQSFYDNVKIDKENTSFFHIPKNKFNVDNLIDGYYLNQYNGNIFENVNYNVTKFIKIKSKTKYIFKNVNNTLRYALYDIDKAYIDGQFVDNFDDFVLETPANAAYIRISIYRYYNNSFMFAETDNINETFEAGNNFYVLPQYIRNNVDDIIFNLPSKLYGIVGEELNVYFDNLVSTHDTDYMFDIDGSDIVGNHYERGLRGEPTQSGTYDFVFKAVDKNKNSIQRNTKIIVSDKSNGDGVTVKVIILGDSTTNNGIAVTKLNENFANDVMSIQTLGTRGTGANKHEGRSGWTFAQYFNNQVDSSDANVVNPFYNPITMTFDAQYYFDNSEVEIPDWFIVNLGINDTFAYTDDGSLESAILTLNDYCDKMIESVKSVNSSIKIGIALTIPPNYSQDAFGKSYKNKQTRDRYKRNNALWVSNLISRYDSREDERIYLIPIYTNLDTKYNMGLEELSVNKRNSMTYLSPIANGGVHPVESGYWQIADVYWYFLKAQYS